MDRHTIDNYAWFLMKTLTLFSFFLLFFIIITIFYKSLPLINKIPLITLLLSSQWYPLRGDFGFFSFIIGSILVTIIAMVIAIPISLFVSIYLSEYSSKRVRKKVKPLIDLLAGIPSVIFGLWGVSTIVQMIRYQIAPFFNLSTTGYCVLSAGVVLAVMVLPLIISLSYEVMSSVPTEMRETSIALGATRWQTAKHVIIRDSSRGILAAIVLGFTRAFGETMAVLMVVGNQAKVPSSLFEPAYPLPSLIANNFGEMMSLPLYDSALMFAALILLVIVSFFIIISRQLQIHLLR